MECLPSITSAFMKASLPLVIGCPELDTQIRKVKSTIHVFGHTHLNVDKTVDGVRYVQNAFGTPLPFSVQTVHAIAVSSGFCG